MAAFISPVADDAVTKLQNLLQNTLYSFADITITFAPDKLQEFEQGCKELGIALPDEKDDNVETKPVETAAEEPVQTLPGSLKERVERLGELNDHIQATVDELPDTTVSKDEIISQVKMLHEECERASAELEALYSEFDKAFQMLNKHVNSYIKAQ